MNNIVKDILSQIIKTRKIDAFNEFSEIELGGRLVVNEYAGYQLRLFNQDGKTHLMIPRALTEIQESALADAIESGAIFDDANTIDNAATYAAHTTLPIRAMANKSIELPTGLVNITKAVIGTLDDNCHAQCDQREIDNGCQFLKDVCKTGETGNTVSDVVDDYLGIEAEDEVPAEIARDIVDTEKKLRNEVLNSPEDSIDNEDYEEVEIEEGFFSSLASHSIGKLIYYLNAMNDVISNPLLPNEPKAADQSLNILDECKIIGKKLSTIAAKSVDKGKFDKRTGQLLAFITTASEEMSTAADAIANPFIKQDDIEFNEPGVKEAIQKWTKNKETLTKILPQTIEAVEEGQGKSPIQEGFLNRPKKLKDLKMRDTISYIAIEMNAIKDVNDQQMLSGYVCTKLEITDFYISCIDNNDPKYIVPHTRPQLVQFQNDLNRLLTQILKIRPVNKSDRTWMVNVNYPEGWRG